MSYRNVLLIRENKKKYIFFIMFSLFLTINNASAYQYSINGSTNWNDAYLTNLAIDNGSNKLSIGMYADDFEDNDYVGWADNGQWEATNGTFKNLPGTDVTRVIYNTFSFSNGSIRFNLTENGTNTHGFTIRFRVQNDSAFYQFSFTDLLYLDLDKIVGGVPYNIDRVGYSLGDTKHALRLDAIGRYARFYIDEDLKMDLTYLDPDFAAGNFSFEAWYSAPNVTIDDVRIRKMIGNDTVVWGSIETNYNSSDENEIYQIDVNGSGLLHGNYTTFYRQNGTSEWILVGTQNSTVNQSIVLPGKYPHIDVRLDLFSNEFITPEISGITFFYQQAPANIVNGYVLNYLGIGIPTARIDINGNNSFTDSNGYYVVNTRNGSTNLSVKSIGYKNVTQTVFISGNTTIVNVTMNEIKYSSSEEVSEAGIMGLIGGIFGGIMAFTLIKKYIRR